VLGRPLDAYLFEHNRSILSQDEGRHPILP
jgi:hypothetical protein